MCRSRRELSNASLLTKFSFDTAENEPCQVCPIERCLRMPASQGASSPVTWCAAPALASQSWDFVESSSTLKFVQTYFRNINLNFGFHQIVEILLNGVWLHESLFLMKGSIERTCRDLKKDSPLGNRLERHSEHEQSPPPSLIFLSESLSVSPISNFIKQFQI